MCIQKEILRGLLILLIFIRMWTNAKRQTSDLYERKNIILIYPSMKDKSTNKKLTHQTFSDLKVIRLQPACTAIT